MAEVRRTILAVTAALVVAAGARADLAAVSPAETTSTGEAYTLGEAEYREILLFGLSDQVPTPADLRSQADGFAGEPQATVDGTADSEQAIVLKDGRGSLDLCLYTLIGLGLFRSGHWVRRSSLGFIPEWYHSGAPQQIGYSHAVGPDAYCHVAVCFVQPDLMPDRLMPLYDQGTIPALVRTSQFIAAVLACRAPPSLS